MKQWFLFSVAGLVEKKMTSSFLDSGADNHTASGKTYFFVRNFSIWWQIPQYSLMGMSEVFTSIPGKYNKGFERVFELARKRLPSQLKGRYYKTSSDLFSSFYCLYLITVCARDFFLRGFSLRKQPTFGDATTCFPAKWLLRNEGRNSIVMTRHYPGLGSAFDWSSRVGNLMTRHYPGLGSAFDWSSRVGNLIQPIRGTTQIWVVTRHQYRISALVSQMSFGGSFLRFPVSVKCSGDSDIDSSHGWKNTTRPGFPAKWCLRNERRIWHVTTQTGVVLLIGRCPKEICFKQSKVLPKSTSGYWRDMISISPLVLQTLFRGETSGMKCRLFTKALNQWPQVQVDK